nr:actin cytoskeleton-regulatory complex protein PAN1-like [Lolium perenne]
MTKNSSLQPPPARARAIRTGGTRSRWPLVARDEEAAGRCARNSFLDGILRVVASKPGASSSATRSRRAQIEPAQISHLRTGVPEGGLCSPATRRQPADAPGTPSRTASSAPSPPSREQSPPPPGRADAPPCSDSCCLPRRGPELLRALRRVPARLTEVRRRPSAPPPAPPEWRLPPAPGNPPGRADPARRLRRPGAAATAGAGSGREGKKGAF